MRLAYRIVALCTLIQVVSAGDVDDWIAELVETTQGMPGANVLSDQLGKLAGELPKLRDPVLKVVWPHVLYVAVLSVRQSATVSQFLGIDLIEDFVDRASQQGQQLQKTVAMWSYAELNLQQELNALTTAYSAQIDLLAREMGSDAVAEKYADLDRFIRALNSLIRARQSLPQAYFEFKFSEGHSLGGNLNQEAKVEETRNSLIKLEELISKEKWALAHSILDCVTKKLLPQAVLTFFMEFSGVKYMTR